MFHKKGQKENEFKCEQMQFLILLIGMNIKF